MSTLKLNTCELDTGHLWVKLMRLTTLAAPLACLIIPYLGLASEIGHRHVPKNACEQKSKGYSE